MDRRRFLKALGLAPAAYAAKDIPAPDPIVEQVRSRMVNMQADIEMAPFRQSIASDLADVIYNISPIGSPLKHFTKAEHMALGATEEELSWIEDELT